MAYHLSQHQQVCWSATVQQSKLTSICTAAEEDKIRDKVTYQKLDAATPQPGIDHDGQHMTFYPMLSERGFVIRLQQFHEVLVKVIVNIVDRWWDDTVSDFPSRMPLQSESEGILKSRKGIPALRNQLSHPFNAIVYSAYKHQIMGGLLRRPVILEPAGDSDVLVDGLLSHFDLCLPIHIVRGRDSLDRGDFALLVEQKTGWRPKMVSVSELQLRPDPSSKTGFALYCSSRSPGSEIKDQPERVYQTAMVFPDEYSSLSTDMLRRGGGIVPTILPGSQDLKKLLRVLRDERGIMKNGFVCKAARSSRGNGHLLGSEISKQEWESVLLGMQDARIRIDATSYVLQPYVQQPKFDIVVDRGQTVCDSQMVGSYFAPSGRYAGLAPWRTGNGKICNVYGAGCVIVASVTTIQEDSMHPIQICPSASKKSQGLISPDNTSLRDRKQAEETYLSVIFQYTSGLAHLPYELRYMSPNPILVSRSFLAELERFHHALSKALNNIVARWFSDREAGFPTRMPLERHEEELLQWVSQQSENNVMHPYAGHQGNWRPELLLPADGEEAFKMCEINARYPFNCIELTALFYQALDSPGMKPPSLDLPADPKRLFDAIFKMFNPSLPIHFLQSRNFIESRKNVMAAFFSFAERRTGRRPRVVSPEQLRLVPDSSSRTARVIPTIIPGSKELHELLRKTCHEGTVSKTKIILKPIRASRGAGIRFGDEMSSLEWEDILTDLQDPDIHIHPGSERTPYVIQPVVTQAEEELFLDEEMGTQRCHRVGAYHAVNGEFVGLGAWRVVVSSQRTCNMATGRAWKLGSMVVQK
ncbi:uncharacterized protein ATNIH1004_006122 [Aspergillus tanneri]|uniref:Uncharacterized protein n=1 Tax=Aspergillus tanneri TaxID=1220188 RepID=A0A5M9MS75_9EURO|nr:uncharacterized protein ATNIH1004_006122 [Aspergillus tanneri]KAA8647429.1 hypothetical protein ATNIH1004_006122 [Aspergillus tanneri]